MTEHHNIGNWHWTERDFSDWATPKLKELLTFTQNLTESVEIEVTAADVKGEAFKYIRKNKVHSSYDYKCKLEFKLKEPGCDLIEGSIHIEPFVDDENMEEWEWEVKIKKSNAAADKIKQAKDLVNKGIILPRIQVFLDEYEKKMD
ncbi:Activator_of Hsp90 ATPase [Hexamita inflata]|uniref:Activator of Hsp90 ATPase n=1 Tax=Hexamita inflata TaxID=28002 RepID=A0AA86TW27_9EUKA|nr:Activator of Hsp90 ATPase [Hexamita inflata]CAI9962994.1 Activator of Hsp90 ATPase [Hexamita inflata]